MEHMYECPEGHKFKSEDGICPEHKKKGKMVPEEEDFASFLRENIRPKGNKINV